MRSFSFRRIALTLAVIACFSLSFVDWHRPKPETAEQQKLAVQQAFGDNLQKLAAASPVTHARTRRRS